MNTEKAFAKTQHPLTIKTFIKTEIEGNYPNLLKSIGKHTDNITIYGEKCNASPTRSERKEGCLVSALLFK